MSEKRKAQLICLCLSGTVFTVVARMRNITPLPLDIYKRFQVELIVSGTLQDGYLASAGGPGNTLYPRAESLIHSPANPLIVLKITKITDLSVLEAQSLPIYAFIFVLSQIVVCRRLVRPQVAYIVSPAVSILLLFPISRIISTADRHILAWIFFLFLVWFMLARGQIKSKYLATCTFLIISIGFIISDHTHPVSLSVFLLTVTIGSRISSQHLIKWRELVLYAAISVSYFFLLFKWGPSIFVTLFRFLEQGVDFSIQSFTRTPVAEPVIPYVREVSPSSYGDIYFWWSIIPRILALLGVCAGGSVWLLSIFRRINLGSNSLDNLRSQISRYPDTISKVDIFMIGLVIQMIANIVFTLLFASSDGLSPIVFSIVTAPILIAYAVGNTPLHQWLPNVASADNHKSIKNLCSVVILILLTVTNPILMFSIPDASYSATDRPGLAGIEWTVQHGAEGQTISSDFNTLSAYVSLGGRLGLYLPKPSTFRENERSSVFIDTYYRNPPKVFSKSHIFILSNRMVNDGMYHLGGLATKPNQNLDKQLSVNKTANKVHSAGSNASVFVRN